MTASLAEGNQTVVSPEATPISSPPNSVAGRLPTPPTMMATKLGISTLAPIVGSRLRLPPASTPARPARKMPTAKFIVRSARTLTPSAETVSRSSVPARIRTPRRVEGGKRERPKTHLAAHANLDKEQGGVKEKIKRHGSAR